MRRHGSITTRHLVVAVLVVLVVNAQLTWWIIFVLGENRTRLGLERDRLTGRCAAEAARIAAVLGEARSAVTAAIAAGAKPGDAVAPPAPFTSWHASGGPCARGWVLRDRAVVLRVAAADGCIDAVAGSQWRQELLAVGSDLEVVDRSAVDPDRPPLVGLPPPFDAHAVRPHPEVWREILKGYRGRIGMIVSEGAFFAVLLFVLIALLVRTLRREAELERRHRNFLSAITHELKSPLASVRLALETVLAGRAEGGAGSRFLSNALQDAGRLQDLVQKVLEVTRYDRGSGLELRRASLSDLVRDAVSTFERRAAPVGAAVTAELAEGVWTDLNEEAFEIAVSNLLENAAKYAGSEARIGVRLALAGGRAVLEVSDNGPGIAEDDIPFIFDRFYRAGDEMTRTTNGTGLGLYLVKQIVAAHRGTVAVSSTGPDGTTFRVLLPGAQAEEARP